MRLNVKNIVASIYFSTLVYLGLIFSFIAYADPIGPGGGIIADTDNFKQVMSEWGTTFSGICVLVCATLAITSIFIPWDFYKNIGRKAWGGLIASVVIYLVLSYFGNSIHQALLSIFGCPFSIIGVTCGS